MNNNQMNAGRELQMEINVTVHIPNHAEPDLEKELNAMDGAGMLIYKSAYKEAYDKAYSEAYSDAYSEAEIDLTNTSIKRMLDNNLDDTTIQKILDVPIERIEKIRRCGSTTKDNL